MNKNLKKTVLDDRQILELLLALFSAASLIIAVAVASHPPDMSLSTMTVRYRAEVSAVETFGFLLPPLQSFVVPLVTVTALLAGLNFGLSLKKKSKRYDT